ncbi:hypothetical protein [Streptomyces sp. GC420]|uniref:hypothetical protein n=1 Tax=Streptomyces sp. GC420 TaxID=2697568 RepID=UPI001FB73C07|nr:hypothetical protein [Streptomyces sp. GC420]
MLKALAGHRRALESTRLEPLAIPPRLPSTLGCDAVGVPERFAYHIMARLPRVGCVFAAGDRLWLIVPAGSDIEVEWPEPARYAAGAAVPVSRTGTAPRLVHWPDDSTPYTPPIPLYLMVCQLAGTEPAWAGRIRTPAPLQAPDPGRALPGSPPGRLPGTRR